MTDLPALRNAFIDALAWSWNDNALSEHNDGVLDEAARALLAGIEEEKEGASRSYGEAVSGEEKLGRRASLGRTHKGPDSDKVETEVTVDAPVARGVELLPCPFCTFKDNATHDPPRPGLRICREAGDAEDPYWWGECDNCLAHGPVAPNEDAARIEWNRRAEHTELETLRERVRRAVDAIRIEHRPGKAAEILEGGRDAK